MRAASAALIAVIAGSPGASRARPAGEPALVPAGAPARRERTVEHVEAAGWRAIRDRETGVVLRMWGGRASAPGAVRDPAVAERAARDFVGRHLALLAPGARLDELVLDANRLDDRVRTVVLRQTWRGLRVVGGYVHVAFAADRLFAAGSEALPHVSAAFTGGRGAGGRGAVGRGGAAQAEAWLRRETGQAALAVQPTDERVVLPIVRGPGAIEYRVADVLLARGADPAAQWDVYVDGDGAPIARRSRVRAAAATLRLDVADRYPGGPRTAREAASANLVVDGTPATTAGDGSFTWAGTAPATVVPSATGTFVQIATAAGPAATAQLTAQPDQPLVWSLAADELGDAQLAAYAYATAAKAQGRRMQPALAWLDRPLTIHVNIPGACNALSTGDTLYFYRGSAACENTARLADVVTHELGHS